jgi:Holliday junction resolvasome RuvABC endonuclease subunit
MKRNPSKPIPKSTILTNDPSMTAWGWAVVSWDGRVIKTGCIKTEGDGKKSKIRKSDQFIRRIGEVNKELLRIIEKYNVAYILSELPHGSQSAIAAKMLGAVSTIVKTIGDCKDIGIEWYSENDVKKCLFGKGSVSKDEMLYKIGKLYKVPWTGTKWRDEGVADAMGVFHTAFEESGTIKLLKKQLHG